MPFGPQDVSTNERPALFISSGAGDGLPRCCLTMPGHQYRPGPRRVMTLSSNDVFQETFAQHRAGSAHVIKSKDLGGANLVTQPSKFGRGQNPRNQTVWKYLQRTKCKLCHLRIGNKSAVLKVFCLGCPSWRVHCRGCTKKNYPPTPWHLVLPRSRKEIQVHHHRGLGCANVFSLRNLREESLLLPTGPPCMSPHRGCVAKAERLQLL